MGAAASLNDPLLENLVGKWVLRGDIAGKHVIHSVEVQWVLAHEYIQIHETSRSKSAAGAPDYDAIVYIGWDLKQFACLRLDSTDSNGLTGILAHAKPDPQRLAFTFPDKNGEPSIQTTFAYDRAAKIGIGKSIISTRVGFSHSRILNSAASEEPKREIDCGPHFFRY
jgi:hypothetical protein